MDITWDIMMPLKSAFFLAFRGELQRKNILHTLVMKDAIFRGFPYPLARQHKGCNIFLQIK